MLRVLSKPVMDLDRITASASPSPNRWSDKLPSREMTKAEIQEMIDAFAKSSKMLKDAGVDGVEVHAVHEGYLLDQFALKYVNRGTDEYGETMRLDIVSEIGQGAIKKECGKGFPRFAQIFDNLQDQGLPSGRSPRRGLRRGSADMEESEIAASILQDAGYDMLNCDSGTYDAWYWAHPPPSNL